eukprot:CAMPEP_0182473484 /NCGR_PEP_ID=MMETSP1319-20130603/23987_2 /TAXON_ID=172717 /ORGANISM="Bolidomonas pacifica, Strain RCC208" /LENGTH=149 /DNA_ID=CAMNT_0024674287 /DNA_START=81 /DNA_END=527 /DNA_ORIENTATION=-
MSSPLMNCLSSFALVLYLLVLVANLTLSSPLRLITTPNHKYHAPPPGVQHAEVPARLDSILSSLATLNATVCPIETASNQLQYVQAFTMLGHAESYLKSLPESVGSLTPDTYNSPTSYRACMSAASCWLSASSASPSPVSFALTRPPGH